VRAELSGSADELRKAGESLKKAAGAAVGSAADAVKNMKVPDMAKLDVDIRQTVTWNFLVQLALTAISWAIAFFTSHTTMAKVSAVLRAVLCCAVCCAVCCVVCCAACCAM